MIVVLADDARHSGPAARRADAPALLERLRAVRAAGDVPLVGDPRWPAAQWDAVRRAAASTAVPDAVAWATLTSGSSGAPRIVLRTASSWAASFEAVAGLLDAGPDDAVALPAPPASSLTLFSLAHALGGGPRPVLGAPGPDATCLHGTPQALRAALDAGRARLRTALIGGSHLDPALRERAEAAGIRVTAYYGAAELSFVAADDGSGLRAFPGVELEVRDGVLWVRSPYIALGYAEAGEAGTGTDGTGPSTEEIRSSRGPGLLPSLHPPGVSAAASSLFPGPLRRDGDWATVGDRAEIVEGVLRLRGRSDDAILSASATIVPEEVEAVLRAVPGVRDVVVFGLPRGPVGALVAAVVEADGTVPLAALREAATTRLAPAHRPRRWFAGTLPRTASGKPARAEIARMAIAGEVTRVSD